MVRDEILLRGARFHPLGGHATAAALLVRGGRVAALGDEALAHVSPSAVEIDLAGATVTPGLVDSHAHPTAWALARRRLELRDAASADEVAALVAAARPTAGEWIVGQGWDAHAWGAPPHRAPLDRAARDRPVLLESHDLHAAWVNGEALRRCGIDRHTPDPPGGTIVRDERGEPTGVLLETARSIALDLLPRPGAEEISGEIGRAHV